MESEFIRVDSTWDLPQAADLNTSLASLPEEISCSNQVSRAVERTHELRDLSCKSVPEEIHVEVESQQKPFRQQLTIDSIIDEVIGAADASGYKSTALSHGSPETSTCVPGTSHEEQADKLLQQLDGVLADLDAEKGARARLQNELETARAEIHEVQVQHLDASYRAEDVQYHLDAVKGELDDAVMGRLDASYRAGAFKSELEKAKQDLEEAVMDRLDSSYEKVQLGEQLDAANDQLEELLMERLDRDYVESGLNDQLSEAKQKMEELMMARLDASYDRHQVQSQLQKANSELEEAFMERLEASYVQGGYRAQLEDAKQQLQEALHGRFEASLRSKKLEAQVKRLQDERDEAEMRVEDLQYEAGKPTKIGEDHGAEIDITSRSRDVTSKKQELDSIANSHQVDRDALSDLVEAASAPLGSTGRRQCADNVEKVACSRPDVDKDAQHAARTPGFKRKSASPGPSKRPLGPDAIMPAVKGQQRMARDAQMKAEEEKQARERELDFRKRLRQRLVDKHRHGAKERRVVQDNVNQRRVVQDDVFDRRFGPRARQASPGPRQGKAPAKPLGSAPHVSRNRQESHKSVVMAGEKVVQRPAAQAPLQSMDSVEQGSGASHTMLPQKPTLDSNQTMVSDPLRGAGDIMLKHKPTKS